MSELSKTKKQKLSGCVITALLVLAVILCVYVVAQVLGRGYVTFGPYSLFRVVTGSMEPEMPIGTLLVCEAVDITQIEVRDIVCFRATVMGRVGEVVTHRVVNILPGADGLVMLETKGDANLAADLQYVTQSNLVGRVSWYSKTGNPLPDIMSFLTSSAGFVLCIAVPSLLIVGMILKSCVGGIRADLQQIVDELAQEEENETEPEQEDYGQMEARIRRELMEELGIRQEETKQENVTGSAEEMKQDAEQ